MKLTTQMAVVISVGIVGLVSMILCLALWADWKEGSIVGLASGFATVFAGVLVALRNQHKAVVELEQQNDTLAEQSTSIERIVRQTNGKSDAQLQEVADRAAVSVLRALRAPDGTYRLPREE